MAKSNNVDAEDSNADHARLITSSNDKVKARKWFQRGRELGDKRQFGYAIEYYVNGLEFWPDAVEEACKPLHGCAVARRQTGGKKPGLKETMKRSTNDKDPHKALLNAFWLFGRDPDNLGYIEGITKAASRLRAEDVARWAASIFLKGLESTPKPAVKQFQSLTQLLEEVSDRAAARNETTFGVELLEMAVEALSAWRRRFPKDEKADNLVKNLSTKLTILRGKYDKSESFLDSIQDSDQQRDLHDEQRSVQSDDRMDQLVAKAKAACEKEPQSDAAVRELVELLCRRERDEEEGEAIRLLFAAHKRSNDYRWKHSADDIKMKQIERKLRRTRKKGDRAEIKAQRIAQLRFELGVFKERMTRYPTDNRVRFEYGIRNFDAGRFDEAIPMFQAARSDPRNRAACGMYLGRCFFRKGYHDQAIPALEDALSAHEFEDDDLAKEMLYWLGRCQEGSGDAFSARKTYGKILQMDYNFRDIRARLDGLPS